MRFQKPKVLSLRGLAAELRLPDETARQYSRRGILEPDFVGGSGQFFLQDRLPTLRRLVKMERK